MEYILKLFDVDLITKTSHSKNGARTLKTQQYRQSDRIFRQPVPFSQANCECNPEAGLQMSQ